VPPGPAGRVAISGCTGRALAGGVRVLGRQPGQLRVDVAHHCPDRGDPCLQIGRVRALTVGVELVDGLSHVPESGLVYRTHRRRLSGRRCLHACFGKCSIHKLIHPSVDNACGLRAGKIPAKFFLHTTGGPRFPCSRWYGWIEGHPLHSSVPSLRTTCPACLHTLSTPSSTA